MKTMSQETEEEKAEERKAMGVGEGGPESELHWGETWGPRVRTEAWGCGLGLVLRVTQEETDGLEGQAVP